MLNISTWKIYFIAFICLFGVYFSLPSFLGDNSAKFSFLPEQKVNLGLDLRGGSYLLLEVDFNAYMKEQLDNLRNDIRANFRGKTVGNEKIQYTGGISIVDNKVIINLINPTIVPDVVKLIKGLSNELSVNVNGTEISVKYDDIYLQNTKRSLLEQSIEIVRRRVDETGTREPDIQRQGDNRILLQVPGLDNPEHLKNLLGKTAKLTFHLLDDRLPYPDTTNGIVPPETIRLKSDDGTSYAIKREVMLSGDLLVDARAAINNTGQPVVTIRFNNLGSKKFADITKANVGKPFAIVLDGNVITAPVIRQAIMGGSAEISGHFTTKEANDVALLLRAGSLPAPLTVVEERSVGPSLGADSIQAGMKAMIASTIMVTLFMFISYGLFGLFADIALYMNMVLIMAVMSIFGATLTLPGIAGLILTIGMAVDANVLIFERIREEIRLGKSVFAAVDNGFQRSFATIVDSHITTITSGILLYAFGSGAVKGFAVTLIVGLLASMFSAVLLTRFMVVIWLKKVRPKTLSI